MVNELPKSIYCGKAKKSIRGAIADECLTKVLCERYLPVTVSSLQPMQMARLESISRYISRIGRPALSISRK
jgi:hypothetical protein